MTKTRKLILFLAAPILTLAIFTLFFQLWKIDFNRPFFDYDGNDGFFSIFLVKNIIDSGWIYSNDFIGAPQKFFLHDYPLGSDFFNFAIIKFLTIFSSDVFFVLNIFFLLTFILISATTFLVLRHFKISAFTAIIISILYAFLPYHFGRNVAHLLLSNYMAIPLSVMCALWIAQDKIRLIELNKKGQICVSPNRFFVIAFLISCFAALSGIYYAFYTALIFFFAIFLRAMKSGKFFDRSNFSALFLVATVFFILFCANLPSLIYWLNYGFNGAVSNRYPQQSEQYALRIINLLLPIVNHHIDLLKNLRLNYDAAIVGNIETGSSSLGILGSAGFLFLLFSILTKKTFFGKNTQNLISDLSGLNLLTVLFATAGGLVMLIALPFPLIRSHARIAIFIAFFSFFLVAIIFDKIIEKKKKSGLIIVSLIFILALFDQVGQVSVTSLQNVCDEKQFESDKIFVEKIEQKIPQNSQIFVMPVWYFPEGGYELMRGYLHSKHLRWSYPAMRGRESEIWQHEVVKKNFSDFLSEIKKAGFNGIVFDRKMMVEDYSDVEITRFETQLKLAAKSAPLVSQNLRLVFFEI